MQVYWTAALAFGIVIALFAVQNSSATTIRFLWMSAEGVPLSVLVMICAALGALVTLMFGLGREVRLRWGRRQARRTIAAHEKRIGELEQAVEQLTTEKAALQTQIDAMNALALGATRYEAVPVDPPEIGPGTSPTPLPRLDPPTRP
jgi:uncharacterized integral membrane protein